MIRDTKFQDKKSKIHVTNNQLILRITHIQ